jgi:hypothetical protein
MNNLILVLTVLIFITNCESKKTSSFVLPDQETETREPSGFFDFLKKKPESGGITLMKCANCNSPHADPGTVQLETEKTCSPDRLYYQDEFKKISDVYKNKRDKFPEAEFPPACSVYIMRSWDAYDKEHRGITECKEENALPERGKKLACITSEYAYSTYNAYVDVMDCLDIPQRELLPKLWNESFFQVNAYGGGEDAGVGQLTNDAIQEVVKQKYAGHDTLEIEYYKEEMRKSNKASCNRILEEPTAWTVVDPDRNFRCNMMKPSSSPLRNILYTAIFYRVITERITGIYYKAGKETVRTDDGYIERIEKDNTPLGGAIQKLQFKEKMQALGIENPNMTYIKQVLVTLAFNAGSRTAVSIFDDFLKARIANKMTLTDKELDFINADSAVEIALIDGPKGETDEAKEVRLKALEKAREVSYQRPLPQFIRLMQVRGSAGYVSKVGFRGTKLNKEIGANLCTQPLFLQHFSPSKSSQPGKNDQKGSNSRPQLDSDSRS